MRFLLCSRPLILSLLVSVAFLSTETSSQAKPYGAAQRLRLRVDNASLRQGEATRVFVEFLDMNYYQVPNDATREIVLGLDAVGRDSGWGNLDPQRISIRPGDWSGTATFYSTQPGKLFITANSSGLESGQALVLIRSNGASFLSSLFDTVALFETVAYAQPDLGFEILPKRAFATADQQHRAKFQLSFVQPPRAGTVVKINTNLTSGSILYKDKVVGSSIANIEIGEGEDISGEIAIVSGETGSFEVSASVRPNGPADRASVNFSAPRPSKIIFDDSPLRIESTACTVPVTVRLADDGGFPVEPDKERRISFRSAVDSDSITFEPESVLLCPGQRFAQVVFHLKDLPLGNEIQLLATSDQELIAAKKSIVIDSLIEKVSVSGPFEVNRGGREVEFIVHLLNKNGKRMAADWNRKINLSIVGGRLSNTELIMPKGSQQATVRYTSPDAIGKYTLIATSSGLQESTLTVAVVHPAYWLVLIAVLGGMIGGIGRVVHKNCKFKGMIPRWKRKTLDWELIASFAGSLVGGLFLYWTLKLGLSQALGVVPLPSSLDLGTNTSVIFFSGIGGFSGTAVLDRLVSWIVPAKKSKTTAAKAAAAAR